MALGSSTFTLAGGAVSDLFSAGSYGAKATADELKAKGQFLEAGMYGDAAALARQNEQFTEQSTAIKETQLSRSIMQTIGGQQADVASAGFAASGSALDIMRDSATQGAITKAVAGQQGLIDEASQEEQAKSYDTMSQVSVLSGEASIAARDADKNMETASYISGAVKGAAAIGTLFTGGIDLPGLDPGIGSTV